MSTDCILEKDSNALSTKEKLEYISRVLDLKMLEIELLFPSEVFCATDFYFAGGCIYSLWNNKQPKDYDLFCTSKKAIQKLKKYITRNKLEVFSTENATTMGDVQFVTHYAGPAEREVRKFDFKHNMFYWSRKTGIAACTEWEAIEDTCIHFNSDKARDVLNLVTRIPKFIDRGMTISQSELLSILGKGTRPSKIIKERTYIKHRLRKRTHY